MTTSEWVQKLSSVNTGKHYFVSSFIEIRLSNILISESYRGIPKNNSSRAKNHDLGEAGFIAGFIPDFIPGFIPDFIPDFIPGSIPGFISGFLPVKNFMYHCNFKTKLCFEIKKYFAKFSIIKKCLNNDLLCA